MKLSWPSQWLEVLQDQSPAVAMAELKPGWQLVTIS